MKDNIENINLKKDNIRFKNTTIRYSNFCLKIYPPKYQRLVNCIKERVGSIT
jgi:hypothetical protein